MTYDQQILQILLQAGEKGMSVQALAKHVYNLNWTFFQQPDLQEIHKYVRKYLLRNSKSKQSLVERTSRRGFYRLNTRGTNDAKQLMLQFQKDTEGKEGKEEKEEKPQEDLSLSLFDF